MTLLSASGLVTGYARRRAAPIELSSLPALCINSGSLTCLLGPNGSGKSTLLRTLCGLQRPLAGRVEIGDRPLTTLTPIERARHVAYLGAESPPPVPIRVYEYVTLGRHPHTGRLGRLNADDRQRVEQAIADADLTAFMDRDVARLSDGERQRVSLARGLAQAPRVLLLDEPTAHLDIVQRCALASTLRAVIARDATAVVLSTHDLEFAFQVADRLWLLATDKSFVADMPAADMDRRMIEHAFGLHARRPQAPAA